MHYIGFRSERSECESLSACLVVLAYIEYCSYYRVTLSSFGFISLNLFNSNLSVREFFGEYWSGPTVTCLNSDLLLSSVANFFVRSAENHWVLLVSFSPL